MKSGKIVEPVECVLGVRFDVRGDKTTGIYSQVPVTDTFLSLCSRTLKYVKVSCKPNITKKAFLKTHVMVHTSRVTFCFPRKALQIQLYFDEFGTASPLGSKKGIHKQHGPQNIILC